MAGYSFNGGNTSNLFRDINTGVVDRQLKAPETEQAALSSFLHCCLGLANFTDINNDIVYSVTRSPEQYELLARWKLWAAQVLLVYHKQVALQELPLPEKTGWRT